MQAADPNFGPFVQFVESFVEDLAVHNQAILAAVTKVEGMVPGGGTTLPPGMAMGGPSVPRGLPPMPPAAGVPGSMPPMPGMPTGLPPMQGGMQSGGGLPPMPPMPMGNAPLPSGSGGVGALPPGAGFQAPPGGGALPPMPPIPGAPQGAPTGGAPTGVFGGAMPSLGGGQRAQAKTGVDLAFDTIMLVMPELEGYMQLLRNVGPTRLEGLQLTKEEQFALQNEALQERFMRLQKQAQTLTEVPGATADANLVAEAEKFSADLVVHTESIRSVSAKLGLGLPGPPPGPREVPKLQPRYDL